MASKNPVDNKLQEALQVICHDSSSLCAKARGNRRKIPHSFFVFKGASTRTGLRAAAFVCSATLNICCESAKEKMSAARKQERGRA